LEKTMNALAADPSASPALQQTAHGCWKLAAGRAVTLQPASPGHLRIAQGRVWATLTGPHARRAGDLFLQAGESLPLRAGQRVVLEPFGATGQPLAAAFDWVPAPAVQAAHWPSAVAQPASDLRLALGSAGFALRGAAGALLRLAAGVLGLVPAGLAIAMNRLARRDRLMLG
jgi:hypothetical protein